MLLVLITSLILGVVSNLVPTYIKFTLRIISTMNKRKTSIKESQEDQPTYVAYVIITYQYTTYVGWPSCLSFLPSLSSRDVFLCFHSCLISKLFSGPSLNKINFHTNILVIIFVDFRRLEAHIGTEH